MNEYARIIKQVLTRFTVLQQTGGAAAAGRDFGQVPEMKCLRELIMRAGLAECERCIFGTTVDRTSKDPHRLVCNTLIIFLLISRHLNGEY
jgi:hypothetical protein